MAKKLERVKNAPIEVVSKSNLTGLDGEQLVKDIAELMSLSEEAKEGAKPLTERKKELVTERGYNKQGLALCMSLEGKPHAEARDVWMTVAAYAQQRGLDTPDLVDIAEGRK